MQLNNLSLLSFLDGNRQGPATAAAQPKILALVPMSAAAVVMIDFNLGHKQLAVAEAQECRGASGIGAFIEHLSLRRFMKRLATHGRR